jgi:hypothetical protein
LLYLLRRGKVLRKKSGYHLPAREINSENKEKVHATDSAEANAKTLFLKQPIGFICFILQPKKMSKK